jgi:DNA primase
VLLRRYSSQVECFFDSDGAGQKAAERLVSLAIKAEINVRFLRAGGDGKIDPDLLFQDANQALNIYENLRKTSVSALEYLCSRILPNPLSASATQKNDAIKQIQAVVNQTPSQVTRMGYFEEASKLLGVSCKALSEDTKAYDGIAPNVTTIQSNQPGSTHSFGSITPERDLLSLCLHFESLGKSLSQAIQPDWVDVAHPAGLLLNRFLGEFEHDSWPGRDHLDPLLETAEERALVASLLFETPAFDDPVKIAQEGLRQLRARSLEPRLRQIELALANTHADSKSDPISLLKERSELQRQLRQPLVLAAAV